MNKASSSTTPKSPLFVFIVSITLMLLAYALFDFFSIATTYLKYPYEIDYGEGCSMVFLSQLKTHGTYFFDLNDYPFSYATYPPVFMLLGWLFNLFVPSMLMALRLLSLISTCLLLAALYLLIYNRTRQRILSLIFTLSFPSIWFVKLWGPLARVDMLALFFTVTGFLIFQTWKKDRKRYWAFLFFVLAFFTKQNAILAPLSILLFSLFYPEQRKNFFSYLAAYAVPVLSLFFLLNAYTHGEAFKHLVVYTFQRQFSGEIFLKDLLFFVSTLAILLPLASPFRLLKRVWAGGDLIYGFYLVLNLITLPAVAVTGANLNYLIEPALSVIIWSAILSNYWIQGDPEKIQARRFFIFFMLLANGLLLFSAGLVIRRSVGAPLTDELYFTEGAYQNNRYEKQALEETLKDTPGKVLCEDLTLLVQNQRSVFLGCSYPAAESGLWNPARLIADCEQKKFDGIISLKRFPLMPKLAACVEKNYALGKKIGSYKVYTPVKEPRG